MFKLGEGSALHLTHLTWRVTSQIPRLCISCLVKCKSVALSDVQLEKQWFIPMQERKHVYRLRGQPADALWCRNSGKECAWGWLCAVALPLPINLSELFLPNGQQKSVLLRGLDEGAWSIPGKPWAVLDPFHRERGELVTDQNSVTVYSVLS